MARNTDSIASAVAPGPSPVQTLAQLQRILDSPELQGSARRRELLAYLVKETLAGRADHLKGYSVALAVFDRDDSFDPGSDPLVRLETGRLRRSLNGFYANTGRHDSLRITIPKGGNVAHFSWLPRDTPAEPSVGTELAAPQPPCDEVIIPAPDRRRARPIWIVGVLALIVVLVGSVLSWHWLRSEAPGITDSRGPAVIVLPFESMNTDENTHLFASSMTQDLITDLMRFPDFRLYSASTSFSQDAKASPTMLGQDLGVSFVIEGNVQAVHDLLRIGVRLADAKSGQVIWSASYDRAMTPYDLLGMRSELSSTVATALGEPFGIVNATTFHRLTTEAGLSMTSYACVLRAYEYRRSFDDTLFVPALSCLKAAVSRDPDYADAWAMLAWVHLDAVRQDMVASAEQPTHLADAQSAGLRAVKLDPGSQRGLEVLAAIAFSNAKYDEAERLQREALALNPHDPEALAQLGWRLSVRGNWDEGLPALEKAIARSADPPGWYFHLIAVHEYLEGNYSEALVAAERSARVGSAIGLSLAAISHAKLGNQPEADESLTAMAKAWPLLAHDPAAAYRKFQADDAIVETLVKGLRDAGWKGSNEVLP